MPAIPSENEVLQWFERYSNWGRWGPNDELGTLNLLTDSKRLSAFQLVKSGISVSCARPVEFEPSSDVLVAFARRFMEHSGEPADPEYALDSILIGLHGGRRTHIDALSHVFWQNRMYNGYASNSVTPSRGAQRCAVDALGNGAIGRGILLDVAALRGKDWLEPGEAVFPDDLEAAERLAGIRAEPGDFLLVRTGTTRGRREQHWSAASGPGLHAACIPWLRERDIAVLGTDTLADLAPSGYPKVGSPIHRIGIVAMGLWIVDHLDVERLSEACAQRGTWQFLFILAPLKLPACTGSPLNPLAIF